MSFFFLIKIYLPLITALAIFQTMLDVEDKEQKDVLLLDREEGMANTK